MANESTKQRFERNEKIIRDRNVRAEKAVKKYFQDDKQIVNAPIEFFCECSNLDCDEEILLSIKEYEKIHERNDRFILYKGHDVPDVEKIISKRNKFDVVEKIRIPA